ncbi:MAG: helix-turn-helix domain-containing protein [Geminicoccaceae bacterium]|nr:helix-turn-helix domain-containing protein [Geminicoccaceae bacterium]
MIADGDRCWDAVVRREAAADGRIAYAVVTTGIYCRPSCPSPTPLRLNVRIFPNNLAAEVAGFLPCKRCRPTMASPLGWHVTAVGKACAILGTSERAPALAAVAGAVGISRFHFHRVFKEVLGTTPGKYFEAVRSRRLARGLASDRPVTETIHNAGYDSVSRAYGHARERLGMTPATRHAGGVGARVGFTIVEQVTGQVLVAITNEGVCAIEFGDDAAELEAWLRRDLPAAVIGRLATDTIARIAAAVRRAELPSLARDLPSEIREVAFRARLGNLLAPGFGRRHQSRVERSRAARPAGLAAMSGAAPIFAGAGKLRYASGRRGRPTF